MNKEEENQRLMESIYDKGIHFKLDNGRTISIQQKEVLILLEINQLK